MDHTSSPPNINGFCPEDYKYKDEIIKEGIKPIFEPLELTTLDDKIRMAKKIISIIN